MASLSSPAIVSTTSPPDRRKYKRSVSFDDPITGSNDKTSSRVAQSDRPPSSYQNQVQIPKERRRSFLGRRDSSKRLSANLLFSSSTTSPSTSSDYVKKDRQSAPTNRRARHSIAGVPMAYKKGATNAISPKLQDSPQLQFGGIIDPREDQASICHSPTWGDEKNKKKASGWAWRRPSQSKLKQEQELEQSTKPSKKLNKKPPPAMETQRQSATLTNGDGSSESLQMERRPSSSGSLTQAMRGFLSRRSSQTNSPELSRPTSSMALRSQSQEPPKAGEASQQTTFEKVKYEEDEAYVNDIAAFVDQMEAAAKATINNPTTKASPSTKSTTFPAPLNTPPQSRGKDSARPSATSQAQAPPRSTSVPASISRIFGKKDNAAGGYKYPGLNKKLVNGTSTEDNKPNSNKWLNRSFGTKSLTSSNSSKTEPSAGGGYVQRQRMVQQQRSIMGFQDEMAVKSAYDQFLNDSQLPPTPKDSTESVHPDQKNGQSQSQQQSRNEAGDENRRPADPPKQHVAAWKPPTPPAKPISQIKPTYSPSRWPAPASPIPSSEGKSLAPSKVSQDKARPAPMVIQSSNVEVRNHSMPIVNQYNRNQPTEVLRESKDSMTTLTSNSTGTSISSAASRKISPVYQLPPLAPAQTSPLSSKFPEQLNEATTSPTINLNDNTVKLVPTATSRKDAELPPLPPTTMTKPVHKNELLVASENGEGIVRKTSIKRHRSDPEMKIPELKVDHSKNDLPALDFLPELRHQAFTKPKRTSRVAYTPGSPTHPPLSPSQFPIPSPTTTELAKRPGGQMRTSKRTSVVGNLALTGGSGMPAKPIAKLFVICCQCKFWHDLPSKIYEAMALPQAVSTDDNIAGGVHQHSNNDQAALPDSEVKGFQGKIFTQVKCPWCPHFLSTSCCQGWTAITYLHERHH